MPESFDPSKINITNADIYLYTDDDKVIVLQPRGMSNFILSTGRDYDEIRGGIGSMLYGKFPSDYIKLTLDFKAKEVKMGTEGFRFYEEGENYEEEN